MSELSVQTPVVGPTDVVALRKPVESVGHEDAGSPIRPIEAGLGPVSPAEVHRRLDEALEMQVEDPVIAGERIHQIIVETGLTLRQISVLSKSRSRPTFENLVFLAKLPREIHAMVRVGSLPASKAQLIGRYLGDAPLELQIKAARSTERHSLSVAEVQRMGRVYRASHEFRFPE
jgi:hypothetical protein